MPLICFSLPLVCAALTYLLAYVYPHSLILVDIDFVACLLWIVGPFTLRYEIRRYYKEREGWDIEIGWFFTFFFSALYINYCLNPITFSERDPATTLNLRK